MAVTQYVGSRYVPIFADPVEWTDTKQYEPLTIVLHQGNSYTSKQFVPLGINIENDDFWALTGNYNAQVELYRRETAEAREAADNAQADASAAQNDIDTLLPKSNFSAENTVKKYVDDSTDEAKAYTDHLVSAAANVIDYGADPSGENDSTVAIQNCINANEGKTIYFPVGIYRITESIKTPHPVDKRVNIDFNGSTIMANTGNNPAFIIGDIDYQGNVFAGYSHNWFKNGSIINEGEIVNVGIKIRNNHKDLLFDNLYVVDFKTAVQVGENDDNRGAGDLQVSNCLFVIKQRVVPNSSGILFWASDCKVNNTRIYGFQYAIDSHSSGLYIDNVHCLPKAWADFGEENSKTAFIRTIGGHNDISNCYIDTMGKCVEIANEGTPLPNFSFTNCQYYSYKTEGFDVCLFDFTYAGVYIDVNIENCMFDVRRPTPNTHHVGIKMPDRTNMSLTLMNRRLHLSDNIVLGNFTVGDLIFANTINVSPYSINQDIRNANGWVPLRAIPLLYKGWQAMNLDVSFPTFIATDRIHMSINPTQDNQITSFQAKRESATSNPNLKYGANIIFNESTNQYYLMLYMFNTASLWGDTMVKSSLFDQYIMTPTTQQINNAFNTSIFVNEPTYTSTDV